MWSNTQCINRNSERILAEKQRMEKFVKLLKPLSLFLLNTKAEPTACNATSWADRYSAGLVRDIFSLPNFCDLMKLVRTESSGIWCSYSVWVKLHIEGGKFKMPGNKLLENSINNTKYSVLPYKVVTIPVGDTFYCWGSEVGKILLLCSCSLLTKSHPSPFLPALSDTEGFPCSALCHANPQGHHRAGAITQQAGGTTGT